MSYGVSLESMLIPDIGNDYPAELAALENWVINMESQLIVEDVAFYAAMEAEGAEASGVSPSSFVTRIRNAFNNLRTGKKNGDDAAVAAATQEIQTASDEFAEEAEKETDPGKKKNWKKAAAIIAAIVATLALAVGAVALAKNAKGKASSGNVSAGEVKALTNQAVVAAQKAKSDDVVPGTVKSKRYSEEQLAADQARRGTGASKVNPDGSTERILSKSERKDAGRTAQYTKQNSNGNRATRRGSVFQEETKAQKHTRLMREAAEKTAASGGTVSKEQDRRIKNADKKVKMQETAAAHNIIAQANALRGEQKKNGDTPASAPAENRGRIDELVKQVHDNFAAMKQSGGLIVKQSGSGGTFYKRTKQGDQAKVFRKNINEMASAIAQLMQLGYNGEALDMYNQLKKIQK